MSRAALARRAQPWPWLCLGAGVVVLAVVWLGPLAAASHVAFSAHMLLHLAVMLVGAPLLAGFVGPRLPGPAGFAEAMGWYLPAGAVEMLTVLGWHIPLLHDAAARSPPIFAVEQLNFLVAAGALWTCLFTARRPGAALAAAVVAALTFSHMSMFGLLLALVPHLIYDPSFCQGWAGLDRLDDQHLGGALMAGGGLVYLAVAVALFGRAIGGRDGIAPAKTG